MSTTNLYSEASPLAVCEQNSTVLYFSLCYLKGLSYSGILSGVPSGGCGGMQHPHFFGKPSVKMKMVGKMILWSVKLQLLLTVTNTLVGKMK